MQPCHGIEFCASSDMGSDVKSCILQIRFKRRWYGTSVGICISGDRMSQCVFTNTVQAVMVPQWEVCILDTPWRHSRRCLIRLDAM
jgi:hypothetical protein